MADSFVRLDGQNGALGDAPNRTMTSAGQVGTPAFPGGYRTNGFQVTPLRGPVTNVTFGTPACFAAGTRLLGAAGEVAVEHLRPGDRLVALERGALARVRWIGHRTVFPARHPRPQDVAPVRIWAGAFGPGQPHHDLMLSPDHAVYLAGTGVLVAIRYLVNGASVRQEHGVAAVTYYHVELEDAAGAAAHGIVLAEGLAAESCLDTGNRGAFATGGQTVVLHPAFARPRWNNAGCAPLTLDGPAVAAARTALQAQARWLGWRITADPALRVLISGDKFIPERRGEAWCWRLPPAAQDVWLMSRAEVGSQLDGGSDDDRRRGVAVRSITLDGRRIGLDDPRLGQGWHAREPGWRWTDGAARIGGRLAGALRIRLAMPGRYWRRVAGGATLAAGSGRAAPGDQ